MSNWKNDDFAWIHGMNYTPSYASNDVMTWRDFDADVVDRELALAEKLGLNSVRTWLQYIVYEDNPAAFLANFETYLQLCDNHDIRAMPILFDSCFGEEPTIDWNGHWVMSPGTSREVESFWPELQKYVDAVVGGHVNDERVVIWDIMNEPLARPLTNTFVKHWCAEVKGIDPSHPTTVGVAGNASLAIPFAECQDVLSMHSYSAPAAILRYEINLMKALGQKVGKPVIITECCSPAWGQDYEMTMPEVRRAGIGHYAWEVTIGANQFQAVSGLLYPDGTCRRKTEVAAVMDIAPEEVPFPEKPDEDGIACPKPEAKVMDVDEAFIARIKALPETKTTPDTFAQRKEQGLAAAIRVAGLVTVPPEQAHILIEIFHGWAGTTPDDPEQAAQELDTFFSIIAQHVDQIDLAALREK